MGLLVREAATLEALGRVTTVVLDKTGTLTEGKPRLLRTAPAPGVQENELVRLASGAETGSSHPLAEAVLETAKSRDLVVPPSQEASTVPGQGAQAVVEGHRLRAGRLEWCLEAHSTVPAPRNIAQAGETPVHVSSDGAWIGTLLFGDPLRGDAISTVAALHRRNLAVHILSGDGPEAVEAVAKAVGADGWTARATPQAKADHIAKLRADGAVVAMVGDGINDAPALAGAVVDRLDRLPAALDLGKATVRTVRGNLAWAFGYNALLLPVAAGVLYPWTGIRLSPTLAGAAMSLSSVSVVAHSLRLLGFSPKPVPKGPTTPLRSGSSGFPSKGPRPAA
jgi:Cu+-exporting ATPase